jgi:monooxygenase
MSERFDVVIVGAGLSGVGAACHLRRACPDKSFAMLEGRAAIGGTWDLFRYPGIRSDSDMFTFGYAFEPWKGDKALADGPSIRAYVQETARKYGVDARVRFGHKVTGPVVERRREWTIEVTRSDGSTAQITASFLWMCTGYYRYDAGHTPEFPGRERFQGRVVHPQLWPEDLDYSGQRVVVIGSGATAVTLVPAMADRAAHVTMLQRSPSYVLSRPAVDAVAARCAGSPRAAGVCAVALEERGDGDGAVPAVAAPAGGHEEVPARPGPPRARPGPRGRPALHAALRAVGSAPVPGARQRPVQGDPQRQGRGRHRHDRDLHRDRHAPRLGRGAAGRPRDHRHRPGAAVPRRQRAGRRRRAGQLADRISFKGFMLSDVPNFVFTVGYTNASWTLRADLVAAHVCRLLGHMDRVQARQVTARCDPDMPRTPLLDLTSGYVQRSLDRFPKQGTRSPWRVRQNYLFDYRLLRIGRVDDPALEFTGPR